jgi:hypothetical protein
METAVLTKMHAWWPTLTLTFSNSVTADMMESFNCIYLYYSVMIFLILKLSAPSMLFGAGELVESIFRY